MCQYQTLYYDDQIGYVIRCLHCENYQVGFGNLLINLQPDDFRDFFNWLKACKYEAYATADQSIKSIIIPTPCEGLKLYLSPRELKDLTNMFDLADSEHRSQEMMKLFS